MVRLLTPEETAAWLHIDVDEVCRLAETGALPSVKTDSTYRIPMWWLRAWLRRQRGLKPLDYARQIGLAFRKMHRNVGPYSGGVTREGIYGRP